MNNARLHGSVWILLVALFAGDGLRVEAAEADGAAMTAGRLGELIRRVDPDATHSRNAWEFGVEDYRVAVVYDTAADRMRIVIPITEVGELDEEQLFRLMQANFDSALDARYAIARGVLWSVYIHPLSPLTERQFLNGLGQTINIVSTFGTSYTSGMFIFGGGDSSDLQLRDLLERLEELQTEST